MAGLNERYVLGAPLEEYFVDKDSGLPLSNGTLTFYRDIARNTAKTVYELSGTPPDYTYTALPNPVQLSAVGTPQDATDNNIVIYYYPYDDQGNIDLYYVVARDENGVEQFTREAWPNISSANDPGQSQISLSNQISNPQFSEVLINTATGLSTTYTVTSATNQSFALAPDWDIVLSGTGSVIVSRVAITGSQHVPTSPPYVLDINVGGVSACYLRQRFNVNSGLWATTNTNSGNQTIELPVYLSGAIVGRTVTGANVGVSLTYVPSYFTGLDTPVTILNASLEDTDFQLVTDATASPIPLSLDALSGTNGYIDIRVNLSPGTHIQISSIQVVPTNGTDAGGNVVPYDLQSTNRETAFLGDYYIPRAAAKQIPSLLVGWDFPLNPAQFGSAGANTSTASYLWDQTISLDLANSATYARSALSGGLQMTTVGTDSAFYLLQYLSGAQAKKILGTRLAVNVFGYKGSVGSDVTMRIYMFRGGTSTPAVFPNLPLSIGSVAIDGVFTKNNTLNQGLNWTEIPRTGLDTPRTVLNAIDTTTPDYNTINSAANNYGFSGWEITDSAQIADTDKFAIVVTFGYVTAATIITINSISVVPGDLPCRPAVQSPQDVLLACNQYYNKSFLAGTTPATNVGVNTGEVITPWCALTPGTTTLNQVIRYPIKMRATPNITLYNPAANNAQIRDETISADFTNTVVALNSANGFGVRGTSNGSTTQLSTLGIHWSSDARLGIV